MPLHWSLALLVVAIALGPMAHEMTRGRFDFFHPKNPFLIYYALELGLSAMVTLRMITFA